MILVKRGNFDVDIIIKAASIDKLKVQTTKASKNDFAPSGIKKESGVSFNIDQYGFLCK